MTWFSLAPMPDLDVVTMKEIDAIFAVTDALGIHRESLVIPLGPATPGRVRRLPNRKLEITVEAARPLDERLARISALHTSLSQAALARPAGHALAPCAF